MPPWALRQCPVSGRCPAPLRAFSALAPRSRSAPKTHFLSTRNSAIVIPSNVEATAPRDLISHIEPLERGYFHKDRITAFFLTPAFATWLRDDHTFVRKAVERVYGNVLDGRIADRKSVV